MIGTMKQILYNNVFLGLLDLGIRYDFTLKNRGKILDLTSFSVLNLIDYKLSKNLDVPPYWFYFFNLTTVLLKQVNIII